MKQTISGAPDGLTVYEYHEGSTYPNDDTPLNDVLYDVFVNQLGAAEDYQEPAAFTRKKEKMEKKMKKLAPSNKAIKSAPSNKLEKSDFKGLGAGQIRKKAKDAGIDLSDKPFNASAKLLIEAFLQRQ